MSLQIVELNPKLHDRGRFDCGSHDRNTYLQKFANQHRKSGFSTTFVLTDSSDSAGIIGFYSMSASQIDLRNIPQQARQKLPRIPIPAARAGQLAVSIEHQGQGLGAQLLQHAVKRALATRQQAMGVHAIIVDADTEEAASFYRKFGFKDCTAEARSLYLSLGKA